MYQLSHFEYFLCLYENNGKKFLATFLWTADPAQAGGHDYIGHSKLEFVQAEYKVSYNANGGTGAPANQTKTYNNFLI